MCSTLKWVLFTHYVHTLVVVCAVSPDTERGGPFRYPPSMREIEVLLSVILGHCQYELLAAVLVILHCIGFVDVIDVIVDLSCIGLPLFL